MLEWLIYHSSAHPLTLVGGVVTPAEMSAERVPLAYRDKCASLLVPLNRCRKKEWYLPWKCEVCVSEVGDGG